ncbi:MAG: hypothetical protein Q9174_005504, partial [Haloplaca sp. 1 TL-2023]
RDLPQAPLPNIKPPPLHIPLKDTKKPHPTGTMRPKAPPTPSPSPSPSQPPRQPDHPSSSFNQFMDPNRPMPHPDYIFDAHPVNPFTGKAAFKGKVASTGQSGTSTSAEAEVKALDGGVSDGDEEETDKEEGDENHEKKEKGEVDGKEETKESETGEGSTKYEEVDDEEEEEQEERDDEDKENWDKGPYVTKSRLEVATERNENGGRDFYLRRG